MASFYQKFKTALKFISLLKPEFCVVLCMLSFSIRGIPFNQLLQDKICMQHNGTDENYCSNLAEIDDKDDVNGLKTEILKDATEMGLYVIIILTLPAVFYSPLIGPWMDKYPHARKILLMVYCFAATLELILSGLNAYMFNWGKLKFINLNINIFS